MIEFQGQPLQPGSMIEFVVDCTRGGFHAPRGTQCEVYTMDTNDYRDEEWGEYRVAEYTPTIGIYLPYEPARGLPMPAELPADPALFRIV